jgi:hypothetical protein
MRVEVSGQIFSFPRMCACCLGAADTLTASATRTASRSDTGTWPFPFCTRCVDHARVWESGRPAGISAFVSGAVLAVLLGWATMTLAVVVLTSMVAIIAGVALFAWRRAGAEALRSPGCACAGRAVEFLGWEGSIQRFEVLSEAYAAEFLLDNSRKAINVGPEAERAMQRLSQFRIEQKSAERARRIEKITEQRDEPLANQGPLVLADGRLTDGQAFLQWVAKIESQRGPAARRAALDAGLRSLRTEEARDRLRLEASKIEVQAALDKVDGLKTPAAKLRTLQAALDAIRSDDVPDALQGEQIGWLEAAIAEVSKEG